MADWERETRMDYESKGFAVSSGFGKKPALLVVDFIIGFTDSSTPLGGDFSSQLAVTARLQTAFRKSGLPIVYTTVEYKEDLSDGGVFVKKIPSLGILRKGSPNCAVDERIRPLPGELVIFHRENGRRARPPALWPRPQRYSPGELVIFPR